MSDSKITILMATYNGAAFLEEQLTSFLEQSWNNIDLIVSDDGSKDETLTILIKWQQKWSKGNFTIIKGPQTGYADNFRHLILFLNETTDYVAFSDQDDIWHKNKLSTAINKLSLMADITPSMYCSRTCLVDISRQTIGLSPLFSKPPSFSNALTQSLAGGNTIVMNSEAFKIIYQSSLRTDFFSHDWWCYQIITGAGGHVVYDTEPQIDYRQHDTNVFGRNTGMKAILRRVRGLVSGDFSLWLQRNLLGLEKCHDLLLKENNDIIIKFQAARKRSGIHCLLFLLRNGIKRQTVTASLALYLTALIGRL